MFMMFREFMMAGMPSWVPLTAQWNRKQLEPHQGS